MTGRGSSGGSFPRLEWLLTAPSLIWLFWFFAVPTIIVLSLSLRPSDPFGGIGEGWTLQTLRGLWTPNFPAIVWRTLWLSVLTTLACLLLALPAAYAIARARPSKRSIWLLLLVVPFWTSFLIRVFAWKVLLHPEGWVKQLLMAVGLAQESTMLLYRPEAVLIVLIYTSLPFAVLPLYAAAERFDFQLLEAAMDLGASKMRAIWSVFLPGIGRGIVTAALVVFIPALGSYVVPDVVGGPGGEMLGNKIAQRVFVDRNLPQASALSAGLTVVVVIPTIWVLALRMRSGSDRPGDGRREELP